MRLGRFCNFSVKNVCLSSSLSHTGSRSPQKTRALPFVQAVLREKQSFFFTVFNNFFSSSAFKIASPRRHASALVIDESRAIASYRRSLAHDVLSFQKTIRLLGLGLGLGLSRAPSSVGTDTRACEENRRSVVGGASRASIFLLRKSSTGGFPNRTATHGIGSRVQRDRVSGESSSRARRRSSRGTRERLAALRRTADRSSRASRPSLDSSQAGRKEAVGG